MDQLSFFNKTTIVITICTLYFSSVKSQEIVIDSLATNTIEEDVVSASQDYLLIGEDIEFYDTEYTLTWGIHPVPIYYKQEYLLPEEDLTNYTEKILIEAISGNYTVSDALNLKIRELEELKAKNPVIDYQVFNDKRNNEVIIDFLISETNGVFEWSVYRYIKQKRSEPFLILFAYSYRKYTANKEDIFNFYSHVKKIRKSMIKEVYSIRIPKIKSSVSK